ncbi:MAG: response regulator receiver [bacterium]|nr:MAG: response regulator receiver [bacterium]
MDKKTAILLIEDDEVDIMNVQRAFKKNSFQNPLYIANNGLEALALLRGDGRPALNPAPKIILLDINMPKMGGIEFLQQLRSDKLLRSISVFVLTTSNEDCDKIAAYNLNVAGYILKPVSFERFVQALGTLGAYWDLCQR